MNWVTPGLVLLALVAVPAGRQECETSLRGRWVGLHRNETLLLEFYGDSMLVVNDQHPLSYRVTSDSLLAGGDTTLSAHYWFSYCRLLLEAPDGSMITMASQRVLARPLTGRWVGDLGTPDGAQGELRIAAGGTARWHPLPDGPWKDGEWERETRIITFTWAADSIPWVGHYDPEGNALLFDHTVTGSRTAIFHRVFR